MIQPSYEALFQRKGFAIATMFILVVLMLVNIVLAATFIEDGNAALPLILGSIFMLVVGSIFAMVAMFRVHRWTIEATGIRIEERQKVPMTGSSRQEFVPFGNIAELRNLESGFDGVIEIVTRDGVVYQLMRPRSALVRSKELEALPDLQAFAASLSQAIAAAGWKPVAVTEALSFWNRRAGLTVIVLFLVFSIGLASATVWALFGAGLPTRSRTGEAIAILVMLPFGVGYLLHKSIKRRRRVLGAYANDRSA